MIDIGHFSLVLAWSLALYGAVGGVIAAGRAAPRLARSAANALLLSALMTLVSLISLMTAFIGHDYRNLYVWQHSNNEMSAGYLAAAVWGGMDGSMLLWAAILGGYSSMVVLRAGQTGVDRAVMRWVTALLNGSLCFFLSVVLFLTNPFRLVPPGMGLTDGKGLNPLLQNPSMLIHPPCLYMGFTGFVVPFSFCLAALITGRLTGEWPRLTRRWTLVAWGFLTAGIVLGGNWAYIELGWGGFWAWDPVENASFLPWLVATAYLHSAMVEEYRGMFKIWNVFLSVTAYLLAVFGTFLTRSGVVQSVHAFAETDVGWVFLAYIGCAAVVSAVLCLWRWRDLRSENRIESYASREALILLNNVLFLGICFSILWGVLFPVISEAVGGKKSVVGPPFFNMVNIPLFLCLLVVMGAGPIVSWRKTGMRAVLTENLAAIIGSSLVILGFMLYAPYRPEPALAFGLALFIVWTSAGQLRKSARAARAAAPSAQSPGLAGAAIGTIARKPRRFGGLLVHVGVAMMAAAITASSAYKIERDVPLKPGESTEIGRYRLTVDELVQKDEENYTAIRASVRVSTADGKQTLRFLYPERRFYRTNEEITSEVDIWMRPHEDLYIALAGFEGVSGNTLDLTNATAAFKVFVNPFQLWLWIGALIVLGGTGVLLRPRGRCSTVAVPAAAQLTEAA